MTRRLSASDWIILGYLAIVAGIVLVRAPRMPGVAVHLGLLALLSAITVLLAWAESSRGGTPLKFVRTFWPVGIIPICFKQVGALSPHLHPFTDGVWDRRLQALDVFFLGDPYGVVKASAWWPLADLAMLGYLSYYLQPVVLGGVLFARREWDRLREATACLLFAWFVSFLGYFLIPAVGPHRTVDPGPPPVLDGTFLAAPAHDLIMKLEGSIPDAFPSGHALIAMSVLALSWRMHRPTFRALLPFSALLVFATMYLRYHYVVDVAASVVLLAPCLLAGRALSRRVDGHLESGAGQPSASTAISDSSSARP